MKRLLMIFISTASAFFANAQTLEKNPKLNLNFETVADSSYAPAGNIDDTCEINGTRYGPDKPDEEVFLDQ